MDLQSVSLPDWLPWWAVVALLVPVALYFALFLLMPFSTFGLRARLRDLELRIDALHEELRGMTLRLPARGMDPYDDLPPMGEPPIPPAPRAAAPREAAPKSGFGDPVADRMLAYMRDKAQAELQRAEQPRVPRPRAEPRFTPRPPAPEPMASEPEVPAPDTDYSPDDPPEGAPPPRPPRLTGRFGRRQPDPSAPGSDWPR